MVENEYAKAIYELAVEENKVKEFQEYFSCLEETLKGEFADILNSPSINKQKKKEMIAKVYQSFDSTFIHFLYVLLDHNRTSIVTLVKHEYDTLVLQSENVIQVTLVSAKKLTVAQMNKFEKTLSLTYVGKKIILENKVNEELIGGVQIVSNVESFDASVKGTLNKLKESI